MPFIIDAHQDLAYNMMGFGRDYLRSVAETRQIEKDLPVVAATGQTVLGWPEMQSGQVAVIFATLFTMPKRFQSGTWEADLSYITTDEAYRLYQGQIDAYRRLHDQHSDRFQIILNRKELAEVLRPWEKTPADYPNTTHPIGLVLLIEGAEGIQAPRAIEEWWEKGVRIVGPVWAGTRFCGGTLDGKEFTREGYELLDIMASLGMILDIAHMNEKSARQALEHYDGAVIASHANARALLKGAVNERHLSNEVIHLLIERGGVMGVLPYNRFLKLDWQLSDGRHAVTLNTLIDHIDHICQIAGNAQHVGLGSDFDGGFGWPAVPEEINTIADLQKLAPLLQQRGYSQQDIANILGGNWRRFLELSLPQK